MVWEQFWLYFFKLLFRMPFTCLAFERTLISPFVPPAVAPSPAPHHLPLFLPPKKDLRKNGKSPITPELCARFLLLYMGYSVMLAYCGFEHWVTVVTSRCVIFSTWVRASPPSFDASAPHCCVENFLIPSHNK